MCESSCSQEANANGSPIPLGKGQLLYSKKTSLQNKNAALTPAFFPGFMSMIEKAFFLSSRSGQITTFNFCLDKKNMSKKARMKTETATCRNAYGSADGCWNCQDEPGSLPASNREKV